MFLNQTPPPKVYPYKHFKFFIFLEALRIPPSRAIAKAITIAKHIILMMLKPTIIAGN